MDSAFPNFRFSQLFTSNETSMELYWYAPMRKALNVLILAFFVAKLPAATEFPKVFLSKGQIWIQVSESDSHQVTHDEEGSFKSEPVVSPDGSLIAYGYSEKVPPASLLPPLKIVFIDWSAKEIRRFPVIYTQQVGGYCGYGYPEWIDGTHVGV